MHPRDIKHDDRHATWSFRSQIYDVHEGGNWIVTSHEAYLNNFCEVRVTLFTLNSANPPGSFSEVFFWQRSSMCFTHDLFVQLSLGNQSWKLKRERNYCLACSFKVWKTLRFWPNWGHSGNLVLHSSWNISSPKVFCFCFFKLIWLQLLR